MKSILACFSCLGFLSTLASGQPTVTQWEARQPNRATEPIVVCVPYSAGWNMASNPVLRAPGTDSITQVFCSPVQWGCYPIGGWYQHCGTTNGQGLWIKYLAPSTCYIAGEAIAQDTISLVTGWNFIGTISHPVAASSVYSIPPNLMMSGFFGFSSGYVRVDTLRPGLAYWVKAQQAGRIVLSSGL